MLTENLKVNNLNSVTSSAPLISVIVPVYKVEPYLKQCVDSLIHQTYSNIEIVLVDDGSPDNCGRICDEYARLDKRVVAFHKENGGLSDARNYGIRKSSGEYIAFVDSDDYVSEIFIEAMYTALVSSHAEISAVPYGRMFCDNDRVELVNDLTAIPSVELVSSYDYMKRLLYQKVDTGAPWRLYTRSVLGDSPFPVGIYYEDLASVYRLIRQVDQIAFLDCYDLYAYRIRPASIISQSFSPLKAESAIKVSSRLYDDISKWYPELTHAASSRCFSVCRMVFGQTPPSQSDYRSQLWAELKKHRGVVVRDRYARKRERLASLIAHFGPHAFGAFCSFCKKVGAMR